ncbi:MAG: hypothetical protein ABI852_07115 [Gemmatimonadaceae bacterium]
MPHVSFESLPPNARAWVFGASDPLDELAQKQLLLVVDEHLSQWRAHGVPLVCSRDFRDNRFLAIGVDEAATGASGCSIDGLFRTLQSMQTVIGTSLMGGGIMFYRDAHGVVQAADRSGFVELISAGVVNAETPVFDLTIDTVGRWRESFEKRAASSWHARMLGR